MALVEKSADFIPNFEVRDSRANSEDFSSSIGSGDLGKLEREGILSLADAVSERSFLRLVADTPAVSSNTYLRDDEVSIVQAGCFDLYETVMVTELLQLDIFVQFQGIEATSVLDHPLLCL